MATETATLAQEGRWEPGVGWSEGATPIVDPFFPRVAAWRFSGLSMAAEATRYRSATLTLGLLTNTGFERAGRFQFYVSTQAAAAAWSTANPPPTFYPMSDGVPIKPEIDSGRAEVVATYDYLATESEIAVSLDVSGLNRLAELPGWDQTAALWATVNAPPNVSGQPPIALFSLSAALTLDVDLRGNTGLVTWRPGTIGRADRCPRCGVGITPRDDWQRDGETRTRVCRRCYDPLQRPHRVGRRERPPSFEG